MVRRTKEDAEATRQRLLDTAERVFLAQGVSRTSLHQIATAAGLTRGAVYWHFKDKADLFIALMSRVSLPCEQCMAQAEGGVGDAMARLRAVALAGTDYLRRDERAMRLVAIAMHRTDYSDELSGVRERVVAASRDYIAHLETLLQAAQQQGQVRRDVPLRSAAMGLYALVDGLVKHATLAPENAAALDAAAPAVDAYLAGLATPGPNAVIPDTPAQCSPIPPGDRPPQVARRRATA